jgi:hypothetical protein
MHVCLLKNTQWPEIKKKIVYAMIQAQGLGRIESKHNSERDREFPVCLEA